MLQNGMHYKPCLQNMNSALHSLQNPINPLQPGIRTALGALAAQQGPSSGSSSGKSSINVTRVTAIRNMTADSLFGEAAFVASDTAGLITLHSLSC